MSALPEWMNGAPDTAVCIVGCASWDTLLTIDRYPPEGEYCVASAEVEMPGGTSANTAVALARLGMSPRFVSVVGDDARGTKLREALIRACVDCDMLAVRAGQDSDRSIIPISPTGGRTIFWIKGATLAQSDALDVARIFAHRFVYLDLMDLPLWRDLLAQHAARKATATLVGQAVYVAGALPPDAALAFAGMHHVFIGAEWEWRLITGTATLDGIAESLHSRFRTARLQAAIITRGPNGCTVVTRKEMFDMPAIRVDAVDTTGAGDAFAGGLLFGLASAWDLHACVSLANAVGGLATRALGAQSALPSRDEALRAVRATPPTTA